MKKLLIAMTAAAVGTCAWAEESAPTLLSEGFDSWALHLDEVNNVMTNQWWSYNADAVGDGELTLADGKLSLNTGSKKLTGNFVSSGSSTNIANGLYFNATVTFKDPSDTLPTLGAQDKFALVVLDNVESCETYNTEENPVVTPATNLWVIAKYGDGEGVKRAYKLKIPVTGTKPEQDENGGDVLTNLDKAWLDVPHEIVVKAYGNAMAGSQTPRAGFMVMVDGYICTVDCSCAIEGNGAGVINPTQAGTPVYAGDVYLGFAKGAIDGSLTSRYNKNQLLLSMTDNNAELTSVDFQGQGVIDNVSLATTGANFGPDATVITFNGYDANKIDSITVGGAEAVDGVYTITGSETAVDGKVTIVVTVKDGYVLKGEGWTNNGLTYTYAGYTLPTASDAITLNVFAPAADVNGEAVSASEFTNILESLAKKGSATYEITLSDNVATSIEIGAGQTLVLDLNGNTVADIYNEGILTIKDSGVGGTVLNNESEDYSVDNIDGEELTILSGCFNGKILGATAKGISGGKFKDTTDLEDALAEGLAFSGNADSNGYFSVVTATVTPLPELTIPENATAEQEKAAVEAALGTQADAAVKANITNEAEYVAFKSWASNNGGAAAVVASPNAWTAYALDVPALVAGETELTDEDITVETFVQDATAEDAGTFAIEIKIKEHEIGSNAVVEKIKTIIDAEGAASLENGLAGFNEDNVDFDVTVSGGKAKLKVKAKNGGDKFFFKMKFKK